MRYFLTHYPVKEGRKKHLYATYIKAKDFESAKDFVKIRGLNETIISGPYPISFIKAVVKPSILFTRGDFKECLHTLCFLGLIMHNAGVLSVKELLGDIGVLHELVHQLEGNVKEKFKAKLLSNLKKIDKKMKLVGF